METATVAATSGCAWAYRITMSLRHGMPEHRNAPIAAGKALRECGDPPELPHERGLGAFFHLRHVAGHGLRIMAMPEAVECHGDEAVAGERRGERLHELLRACEPVGDDNHGGGRCAFGPEDRDGRLSNSGARYRETRRCAFKLPQPCSDAKQRDGHGEDAKKFHDSIDWRKRRTLLIKEDNVRRHMVIPRKRSRFSQNLEIGFMSDPVRRRLDGSQRIDQTHGMILPANHPLRQKLNDEVHARPPEELHAPCSISYLALFTDQAARQESGAKIRELADRFNAPLPVEGANHYSADLGPFRVKWERHSGIHAL